MENVFRTSTYRNWVMCRAFVADTGEGKSALRWYREHFRIYPLATGPDPDATYVPFSQQHLNTTHARDVGNGEDKPSRNSYDDLRWNEDGSVDLYFGPTPPEGYEQNWIKTLPDQGWSTISTSSG